MKTLYPDSLDFGGLTPTRLLRNTTQAGAASRVTTEDIMYSLRSLQEKVGVDSSSVVTSLDYRVTKLENKPAASTVVAALDDLTDVIISAPSNNQVLQYNGTNWVNQTLSGSGISTLNTLSGATQTFAKTDDTNMTLTITSATTTHTFALAWAGTLADGRIASAATWNAKQAGHANLTSLAALTYVSASFVKMTAAGTFALDTNTYLTGNQTVTLSGDVSGSGATAITTTIGANKVTLGMMATVVTGSFLGRTTAGSGNVEVFTATNAWANLGVMPAANHPALTGEVTSSAGSLATTIAAQASSVWAGKVTDEVGTGKWVFNDSPTFTTFASITKDALTTTNVPGFQIVNSTLSTAGVQQQRSPGLLLTAHAWDTTAVADKFGEWLIQGQATQGATVNTALNFYSSVTATSSSSWTLRMTVDNAGILTATTFKTGSWQYQSNGIAGASNTAGLMLRANGTTFVPTTSTFADTYTASNLLYSNGANTVTGLATANNGVLVTSGTGVPSISSALPAHSIGGGVTIAAVYSASATLDFASTASHSQTDLTITVTGAVADDPVFLSVPSGAYGVQGVFTAFVSAANTVTVRFHNYTAAAKDPLSGTFRVVVLHV
jgi:hypothetical protein